MANPRSTFSRMPSNSRTEQPTNNVSSMMNHRSIMDELDTKKQQSPIRIVLQHYLLKFRMLPRGIQLLLMLLSGGVLWMMLGPASQSKNHHHLTRRRGSRYAKPILARFYHRPSLAGSPPRVLQLILLEGFEDQQRLSAKPLPRKTKPASGRSLIHRYDVLPQDITYIHKAASSLDKGECQRVADWQISHNPTCNHVHEASWGFQHLLSDKAYLLRNLTVDSSSDDQPQKYPLPELEQVRLKAGGAFRWVWKIQDYDGTPRALKTLRIDSSGKKFDLRNFDRHRRDAVAFDQLTSSPLVVDIYGFCSNTGMFDWGEGGDLESIFKREPNIDQLKLLKIAHNVSLSLAHAHHPDERGRMTLAHTDIKPDQFLYQDGYYKLTDFNRVRFLMWNERKSQQCGFKVGKNGGIWRSPEEYAYEKETEKVDVYSLGNVLFFLLTKEYPWEEYTKASKVYKAVMEGKRPKIPTKIAHSEHLTHQYLIQAIEMAYVHDKHERPGAQEIADKLQEGIVKLEQKLSER